MKVILGFNELKNDGMGSAAVTLIKALRTQGLTVIPVHAWHEIDLPGYEESYDPQFVDGNFEYGIDGQTLKRMTDHINNLANDGDVFLHFGSPNWGACILYFKPGIRIITAVHSINPSTLKLGRAFAERVSAFVCISEGVRQRFVRKLKKNDIQKVYLIADAVDDADSPKTQYGLKNPIQILFIGRIEDTSKGCGKLPKILMELRKRNIPVRLNLYGYFHNWEDQWWKAVERCNVRDMVEYHGEVKHEEVYDIMREYDIFIAPSNFEGFSLSISEAMMMGLPCVISRIEGVTDWISENGNSALLASKTNIQEFADAIEKLYRTPGLAQKIGEAARKRIKELASFKSHGEKYAHLIEQVSKSDRYQIIKPKCTFDDYRYPEELKPWGPARLLPVWLKTYLRRFM